ncbi:MAG: hypothetical protein ABI559_12720, partial [Chloroflexota bacterium]
SQRPRAVVGQDPSPDTNSRASTYRFDLTTARAETYARPGALPKIRPSTIDDDLLRRDFSIHAMAIELTDPARGKLFDPTGGSADLHAGLVRVLHDRSFQDDATRILRAARYAARFGFRIEEATLDRIGRDLRYLDKISGTRLRQEIAHVFTERHPDTTIALLDDLGVLNAIHPSLTATDRQLAVFRTAHELDPNIAWALLAFNASEDDVAHLVRRLALTRKQADAVRAMPALRALEPQLAEPLRPSELDKLLSPIAEATLHAYAAAGEGIAAQRVREYLDRKRTVRTILNGDEVVELGIERGPDVADVLAELRAARLDGEVTTREDEARFVEAYLARELAGF